MLKRNKFKKAPVKNSKDELISIKLLQESEHLLNIFPEVVWLRISDHFLPQSDVINLSNSSPFFRNLLFQRRVHFLFKSVLQVIVPLLIEDQCVVNLYTELPCTSKQDTSASLFNCRLVCHSWKIAIDQLTEEIHVDKNWDTLPPNKSVALTFNNIKESYNFSSIDLTERFMKKFERCLGNPFLGKTISITSPLDDPASGFYNKLFILLEIFGKYVENCSFYFSSDLSRNTLEYSFSQMISLFDSFSCLRNLTISNLGSPYRIPTVLTKPKHIENLESLTLRFVSTSFANAIVDENEHISKLTIYVSSVNLARSFVNLTELELFQCSWEEFKVLSDCNLPNWSLKRLVLKFNTGVDWSSLLEILSVRFSETLEELELAVLYEEIEEVNMKKINEDSLVCRLNLQKIKKIHLAVSNYSTFDFLLGMTDNLQYLRISWKVETEEWERSSKIDKATKLEILGYRRKLYKSNVWMFFPKLKTVTFDGWNINSYAYSRREWLRRKNSGIIALLNRQLSLLFKK